MAAQYITGLQHIGIPTNDIEKTVAFYHELGFETAFETVNEAAGERVAFLRCGSLVIETYENHQAAERNGAVDHVALDVTDIEAVFAEIKEAGYPCLTRRSSFCPSGQMASAFSPFWDRTGKRLSSARCCKRCTATCRLPQSMII